MALGSYAVSMRRAEERGRRHRLFAAGAAAVLVVALVGAAGWQVATSPGRGGGPESEPVTALAGQAGSTTGSAGTGIDPAGASADDTATIARDAEMSTAADSSADASESVEQGGTTLEGPGSVGTGDAIPEAADAIPEAADAIPEATTTTAGAASPAADVARAAAADDADRASTADTTSSNEPDRSGAGTGTNEALIRNGWVCDGRVSLEDARARTWSLGRATFRERSGYERVVLHLKRIGSGSAGPASVTAEAIPTSRVGRALPGVRRPSAGQTTVSLLLEDGIRGNLGVRGYRPSGLRQVREFSVYPAARGASRVLVSMASDACFRLRAPGWSESSTASTARIIVDIRS